MVQIENPHEYFYVSDGAVLQSLDDLIGYLKTGNTESFGHHVNSEKNDFANWVEDILEESALAEQLRGLTSTEEFLSALETQKKPKRKKATQKKENIISKIKEAFV